ncbi:MAG: flavin reductase family protein [Pseudomonadota bacterium]
MAHSLTDFVPGPDRARDLRDAFGRFATGVTVVTTRTPDGPMGFTANSFSSVSIDPALVLWCPAKSSSRFAAFTSGANYAIHVLGEEQKSIGDAFARNGTAFDACDWHEAPDGTPLLDNTLARFHCTPHATHDGGDHVIAVGRILQAAWREGDPLVFSSGQYGGVTGRFTGA